MELQIFRLLKILPECDIPQIQIHASNDQLQLVAQHYSKGTVDYIFLLIYAGTFEVFIFGNLISIKVNLVYSVTQGSECFDVSAILNTSKSGLKFRSYAYIFFPS